MSARDFMGAGSLTSNAYTEVEDADPRVGLVNLADVMLVFACGLMLALVTYWNLDISAMTEVVQADEMQEVSGIEDLEDQMNGGGGNSFTQLGMVYEDPTTGKMYMLKEDVGEEGASGGAAGSGAAASGAAGTGADGASAASAGAGAGADGASGQAEGETD